MSALRILHLEDDPHDAGWVHALIAKRWPESRLERVDGRAGFEAALDAGAPDVILSDFSMPGFDGLSALTIARKRYPDAPFIFLSGTIGEEVAVEALRNGATDYVLKDRSIRLIPAIERALGEARDHARRREVERELFQSQAHFQQITENVADLIVVLDTTGRRIYNNPAYRTILGDPSSLRGTMSFDDIHPADRERVRAIFLETVRTGVGQRAEYRFLLGDGSVRYIESQGSVIPDQQGGVANVLVVSRDVTERRRNEERIREQASLLDQARDAIFVTGLDGRVTYWNAQAEALLGWTRDEVMKRDVRPLLFPEGKFECVAICQKVRADGRWQGELRPQTKSGAKLIVESRWTLVCDDLGAAKSVLFINTDVTEQRRIETQFLRTQRMESIGTLAGGIAHDLNNVLTPILVAAQVLQSQKLSAESAEMLHTIEKSAIHGAALVKQVLMFARGSDGERVPVQLRHLISELTRLLRETLPKSIEVRTRIDAGLGLVMGDVTQLNQVLMNFAINARDAMPGGGTLEIAARNVTLDAEFVRQHPALKTGPHVCIGVQDSGTGIPPEVLERIFDPFFTTKPPGKGTGLGLSTVLGIIKGHGGVVQVRSEVGKGACFDVYLPAHEAVEKAKTLDSRSPIPRGHGEGILVIDDEQVIRDVFLSILRRFGYRGFEAPDGKTAVDLYEHHQRDIALVVVDMMMPGMDGRAVIRALRKINPQVNVIVVSGMLENDQFNADGEFGEVELIRKPVMSELLLGKVAQALGSRG
ncbi:hybrid sensor histidine kinase/response regulator [Nibricoccus aquaticus]|uniref:histidine kinase n=1 Tax=Nibricoccus aquaticus TaxID=2576891 RepID=A0A290QJJ5_9BACT|nr:PAS domain S-box protein [Nibricoccus aquaticus]ATC65508.1 hybrid sensor histidine kinase/response regulator [Nibricoccus aquaticus]